MNEYQAAAVNGKVYDWADVDLKLPGLSPTIQEISYDDEREAEEVYGKHRKPCGYGFGNYKASGKLTMLRDDYEDLLAYCESLGVSFYTWVIPSMLVSYANAGEPTHTDELRRVLFTKRSFKRSQGDKKLTVDLDFMVNGGIVQDGREPV